MKNKLGFTLAEIMIVLVLVGVISVLTIQTVVMQKSSFTFSCYHFFRDLKIAVGHMGAQTETGGLNSFSCEKAKDVSADAYQTCVSFGKSHEEEETNDYIMDYRTGRGFCQGLARTLGTASAVDCTNLNNATLTDVYGSMTNESFRLMNGYIIYVSDRQTDANIPYRIITVDLNGNKTPNKKGEDIISFAIFDNGEILPVGEAATSTKHFMAVIKIQNVLTRTGTDGEEITESQKKAINAVRHPDYIARTSAGKQMSFKDAYCRVFGASEAYSAYCSGYSDFSETFKGGISVKKCLSNAPVGEETAEQAAQKSYTCEFTVIKPQVSKIIPISQDVYSSKNNEEDKEDGATDANQIYKY